MSCSERYLDRHDLPVELIKQAIRQGTLEARITPVLCGSAYRNKGVRRLLDAVVDYLPSPADMPPVVGENPDTLEREERAPTMEEPMSAVVFKIMTDPYSGKLAFFRVYSGRLATGDTMVNVGKGITERIGRIVRLHANQREECTEMSVGEIGALVGLRKATTGDTLAERSAPDPAREDRVPGAGSGRCDRAAQQGRPGPALDCARKAVRGGSFLPGADGRGYGPDGDLRHG